MKDCCERQTVQEGLLSINIPRLTALRIIFVNNPRPSDNYEVDSNANAR